jgi:hypothetical protein
MHYDAGFRAASASLAIALAQSASLFVLLVVEPGGDVPDLLAARFGKGAFAVENAADGRNARASLFSYHFYASLPHEVNTAEMIQVKRFSNYMTEL